MFFTWDWPSWRIEFAAQRELKDMKRTISSIDIVSKILSPMMQSTTPSLALCMSDLFYLLLKIDYDVMNTQELIRFTTNLVPHSNSNKKKSYLLEQYVRDICRSGMFGFQCAVDRPVSIMDLESTKQQVQTWSIRRRKHVTFTYINCPLLSLSVGQAFCPRIPHYPTKPIIFKEAVAIFLKVLVLWTCCRRGIIAKQPILVVSPASKTRIFWEYSSLNWCIKHSWIFHI